MLLAGRAIQGLGAAGINVLIELIICDIIPLRERGNYMGAVFGIITLGTALGPFFGGLIIDNVSWRWVFYINLPVAGVALLLLFFFLQVNYDKSHTISEKLKRIDYIGNAIFVASCVSILIALGWADILYPWSSFRVIVPIILGFLGFAIFIVYELYVAVEPTIPIHLFQNRTSSVAFIITFIHSLGIIWVFYFLPVYFQGVLQSSPTRSGVQILPTVVAIIPFAIIGGLLLTKTGQFIPIHLVSFIIIVIAFGLFSRLDMNSSTAEWVVYQFVQAMGMGAVAGVLLPAVQAHLTEKDTAASTGTWGFIRSFGMVWGSAIPSAVFNNRFNQLAYRVSDESIRGLLVNGHAYEHATKSFVSSLPEPVRTQVVSVFSDSLKLTWYVGIAFAGLAVPLVFLEKRIELRKELDTEFGITEKKKKEVGDEVVEKKASAEEKKASAEENVAVEVST